MSALSRRMLLRGAAAGAVAATAVALPEIASAASGSGPETPYDNFTQNQREALLLYAFRLMPEAEKAAFLALLQIRVYGRVIYPRKAVSISHPLLARPQC